jgi:hypothetical protein
MKTAMQELISELKRVEDYPMMPFVIRMATDLLEKEKEQIIDANISGMEFIPVDPNKYQQDAEQYYNQTYKPETI